MCACVRACVFVHSTYALLIGEGTRQLDLANISFVATALQAISDDPEAPAHGDASINNIRFESLNFSYPSSSRRMMGDLDPIPCMAVWANSSGGARKQTYSNHTFVDVAWRFADGMALQFQGIGATFDNCIWEVSGLLHAAVWLEFRLRDACSCLEI
jgi:hypothetical protein